MQYFKAKNFISVIWICLVIYLNVARKQVLLFWNLQFKNSKLNVDTKLHKIDFVFLYIAAKLFFSLTWASRLLFLIPYIYFYQGKPEPVV